MFNVTAEQVKVAMTTSDVRAAVIRKCSICDADLAYIRENDKLYFDSSCVCSSYHTEPEPRQWEDVAELINMQNNPDVQKEIMKSFGFKF